MAHQLVLVVVSDLGRGAVARVDQLLEPQCVHSRRPPRKEYVQPCYWWGRLWTEADVEDFVLRRKEILGMTYERDEIGYFTWQTDNPEGRFDYYEIGGRWNGIFQQFERFCGIEDEKDAEKLRGNVCPASAVSADLEPGSLVTPDGEWHFYGWRFDGEPIEESQEMSLQSILRKYETSYLVAVDAHS